MESLPSYKKPPVVETVLSIQYKPLKSFSNVHLWGYWDQIKEDYPKTIDQEPLESQEELFGDDIQRGPNLPQLLMRKHASRVQAVSDDEQKMIQFQNGRFIFNWRKQEDIEYPRWDTVYQEFHERFEQFRSHISESLQVELELNQWEVTYVNHLLKGESWESESDIPELLPGLVGSAVFSEGKLESLKNQMQFVFPNNDGRLYIDMKKAFLLKNKEELFVLKLTSRGPVTNSDEIANSLSKGREAIVKAFTELSSDVAHEKWEREV